VYRGASSTRRPHIGNGGYVSFRADAPVFGVVFVGESDAFFTGAGDGLLEANKFVVLKSRESFLERIADRTGETLPENVFEVVGVVDEGGAAFVLNILAHMQEVRVDHIGLLVFEGGGHLSMPVFSGDEWL
jgi:hypothetical protein